MLRRASLVAVLGLAALGGGLLPLAAPVPLAGGNTSEFSPPRTVEPGTIGG